MSKKINEFLTDLMKKSGLNVEDDAIKTFLALAELEKIEIPEDIQKSIDKSLISIKDAKNNHPEIKPHYQQLALDTIDKQIEKVLEEFNVDDEVKSDILSELSTYKRVPKLVKKIREVEMAKATNGKESMAALQRQIDELHASVRSEKARADQSEVKFKEDLKSFKINNKKSGLFASYKTVYDDLDQDIKMTTLLNILDKKLQDSGAMITFDDNENLVLQKKDGTNFYSDSNQLVNPKQYIESLLSETRILKTAPATPPSQGQTGGQQQQSQQPFNGAAANGKTNHALKELIGNSIQDLQNSTTVSAFGT